MLKKLRIKFVCINMSIITIMLIFILCTVIHFTRQNMEHADIQMMQEIASDPLSLTRPAYPSELCLPYFSLKVNNNGDLLETSSIYYNLSDNDFFDKLVDASFSIPENTGLLKDYDLRFMHITTPTAHFLIFLDISTEISTLNNLIWNCVLIGIFSFFIFLGISIFFANWAIKPVDQAWAQQKQFIADASHELKTPLTVILANAELMQSSDYNTEQKNHFAHNIRTMAKQMRELIEGMLELSRIDKGSMKTIMRNTDFSTLAENSIYLFEPLYFESGLDLNYRIEPGIHVKGNEMYLKQVIDILLDNALKYAAPSSQVEVKLQKQRLDCILSVSNLGNAIEEADLKNIFRRFYRLEKSRSYNGSYGLGLSIAESIVTDHHGKIWAESKDGVNTFFVRLKVLPFDS